MRKFAAIVVLILIPSLAQANWDACKATPEDLTAWAQTVESQEEFDQIITELQKCMRLIGFGDAVDLIQAVYDGASANPNVVVPNMPPWQLALPAWDENPIFKILSSVPRRTASASS